MKRTLAEILAALAVLVLLASFHHQITRLKTRDGDLTALRQLVQDSVSRTTDEGDLQAARLEALTTLATRIDQLESLVAEASAGGDATRELRRALEATQREADQFKAQIARDLSRNQELVDAYHQEAQALDRKNAESIGQTRDHLRHLVERVMPDPTLLNRELLAPTVQLNGEDTVGSGTLIYSQHNAKSDKVESYVLTSYHVIRNILADSTTARESGIEVTIYTHDGPMEARADMVAEDRRIDAALLKLRSEERFTNVARTLPRTRCRDVRVWDRIWAVGCPLGNDPIPTQGEISSIDNQLSGSNYWMINAPTYFGNSGGGVFLADSRELVGVFSKIYTHGKGNPVVVPHMGLCTPMDLIYEFVDREKYGFVLEGDPQAMQLPGLATPPR